MPKKEKRFDEEEIEEALHAAHGLVASAARMLSTTKRKITRQGVQKYIDKSEHLKAVLHEERETLKDFAEGELYKLMKNGDKAAIMFFLKCQAKERGYIERQEFTGRDGSPLSADKAVPLEVKINVVDPAAIKAAKK